MGYINSVKIIDCRAKFEFFQYLLMFQCVDLCEEKRESYQIYTASCL